jgi:hypothetical protein
LVWDGLAATDRRAHLAGMTEKDKDERRAAALRENLKRRKAQARILSDARPKGSDKK